MPTDPLPFLLTHRFISFLISSRFHDSLCISQCPKFSLLPGSAFRLFPVVSMRVSHQFIHFQWWFRGYIPKLFTPLAALPWNFSHLRLQQLYFFPLDLVAALWATSAHAPQEAQLQECATAQLPHKRPAVGMGCLDRLMFGC